MRYLLALLVVLIVYALVDCVRYANADLPGGLPKAIWVVLIVVFPGAGAIAWLLVSRVTRHAQRAGGPAGPPSYGGSSRRPAPRGRRPAPRPVAPDDDPEFLASLDRQHPAPEPESPQPPDDASQQETDDDVDGSAAGGADEDGGPGTRH